MALDLTALQSSVEALESAAEVLQRKQVALAFLPAARDFRRRLEQRNA